MQRLLVGTLIVVLAVPLLVLPVLWVRLGLREGLWDVFFLQTDASRSLALQGAAVMLGVIVVLVMLFVLAILLGSRSHAPEESVEGAGARSQPKPDNGEKMGSPTPRINTPAWVIRVKGFIFAAFGLTGLVLEFSKPGDDRVWWVGLVFAFSLLIGIYELLVGKE